MKRKAFLYNTTIAASMMPFLNLLPACKQKAEGPRRKIFVLIQLVGGNDGLNTLIPLSNYKNVVAARPNLFIPDNKILPLNGTDQVGLHPSFGGIKDLFDNGLAGFVQGVGYRNQSYSHFRSADIWLTGSKASEVLYTGWMARYLEHQYKNYPKGFPNKDFPHPPAIKVGDSGTFVFQSEEMDMSIVLNPAFKPENSGTDDDTGAGEGGYADQQVKHIREIFLQTDRYTAALQNALSSPFKHSKLYPKPGANPLADQLKVVSTLINSGLHTPVYMVDLKGFDTHAGQVDFTNTTKGAHADLLSKLSQAVTCFWDDLVHMNMEEQVAGMAFSEFGRRIISNSSHGTDHGAAQPLLFFGKSLASAMVGKNPTIPDKVTVDHNLEMQYDFRRVYAGILKGWFGSSDKEIEHVFADKFELLKIFKA